MEKLVKGMEIEFTNKLSGSQYTAIVSEIKDDMVIAIDEYDTIYKISTKWWSIKVIN